MVGEALKQWASPLVMHVSVQGWPTITGVCVVFYLPLLAVCVHQGVPTSSVCLCGRPEPVPQGVTLGPHQQDLEKARKLQGSAENLSKRSAEIFARAVSRLALYPTEPDMGTHLQTGCRCKVADGRAILDKRAHFTP